MGFQTGEVEIFVERRAAGIDHAHGAGTLRGEAL